VRSSIVSADRDAEALMLGIDDMYFSPDRCRAERLPVAGAWRGGGVAKTRQLVHGTGQGGTWSSDQSGLQRVVGEKRRRDGKGGKRGLAG